MRDKSSGHRYHGSRRLLSGPSLVTRNIQKVGSCEEYRHFVHNQLPDYGLDFPHESLNEDPFGLSTVGLGYSLNKKKRWDIPRILKDDIAELQRSDIALRISGSLHTASRTKGLHGPKMLAISKRATSSDNDTWDRYREGGSYWFSRHPTTSYDDIINGEEVHKTARRARLRTLTFKSLPQVKDKSIKQWEFRRQKYFDISVIAQEPKIKFDKTKRHQPLHMRYAVLDCAKPTPNQYNARNRDICLNVERNTRTVKVKALWGPPTEKTVPCSNVARRHRCLLNRQISEGINETLEDVVDDVIDQNQTDDKEKTVERQPVLFSLANFVTRKKKRMRLSRRSKTPMSLCESGYDSMSSSLDLDMFPSTSSSSVLSLYSPVPDKTVSPTEYTIDEEPFMQSPLTSGPTTTISSPKRIHYPKKPLPIPDSTSLTIQLPVHPPTFLVHQKHSLEVIGVKTESCVLMKEGEKGNQSLWQLDKCLDCSIPYKRKKIRFPNQSLQESRHAGSECGVCFHSELDSSNLLALRCGHFFCTNCWVQYAQRMLEQREVPIRCMDPRCCEPLTLSSAIPLMSFDALLIYRDLLEEKSLREEFVLRCPSCRCLVDQDGGTTIECHNCATIICAMCQNTDHRPLSCQIYAEYSNALEKSGLAEVGSRAGSRAESRRVVSELVRCWRCRTLMQRNLGCHQMMCRCGAQFCYYCEGDWNNGNHTECQAPIQRREMFMVDHHTGIALGNLMPGALSYRSLFAKYQEELTIRLARQTRRARQQIQTLLNEIVRMAEYSYIAWKVQPPFCPQKAWSKAKLDRILFAFFCFLHTNDGNHQRLERKFCLVRTITEFVKNSV